MQVVRPQFLLLRLYRTSSLYPWLLRRWFCDCPSLEEDGGSLERQCIDESHPDFATLWEKIRSTKENMSGVLEEWKEAGNQMPKQLVNNIILKLCSRSWYMHALKVTSWLDDQHTYELTDEDLMIRLDLLSRVPNSGAREAARECFDKLIKKTENAYLILLRSYCKQQRLSEAEKIFSELFKSKLMSTPRGYSTMIRMYIQRGMPQKAESIYMKFQKSKLAADADLCWALLEHKEKLSEFIRVDERVEEHLRGLEVTSENRREMLRLYGFMGNAAGVDQVWQVIVACPPVLVNDYVTAISAYDRIKMAGKAMEIAEEMEAKHSVDEFPHRLMLKIYSENGIINKVEEVVTRLVQKNELDEVVIKLLKQGNLSTQLWFLMVDAYLKLGQRKKALKCFKKVVSMDPRNHSLIDCMVRLNELFAQKMDIRRAEEMMVHVPDVSDVRVYNSLMKVYIAAKTEMCGIENRMDAAHVERNEETRLLLRELRILKRLNNFNNLPYEN